MNILEVFALALILVAITALFLGIRVVAAIMCSKKAKELNMNSNGWEFVAFFVPVISVIAIHNPFIRKSIDSISRLLGVLYGLIKKWGLIIQIALTIELVFLGIATYKTIGVYNESKKHNIPWRVEIPNIKSLEEMRVERRNAEMKSIIKVLFIETCVLGLVVFLIKRTEK